jgi:hypothetical protein
MKIANDPHQNARESVHNILGANRRFEMGDEKDRIMGGGRTEQTFSHMVDR